LPDAYLEIRRAESRQRESFLEDILDKALGRLYDFLTRLNDFILGVQENLFFIVYVKLNFVIIS
jgi:hypothetical protein